MSEDVPVEQLIGWTPIYLGGTIISWLDADNRPRKHAEVDDLADWLIHTWEGGFAQIRQCDAGWMVRVELKHTSPRVQWPYGTTIRDALEAAIREVLTQTDT